MNPARPWLQLKRTSPCAPRLKSSNTESTEALSGLRVYVFLSTENTEEKSSRLAMKITMRSATGGHKGRPYS